MYFESPRKSGGGEIEEFEMSPSGLNAIIKFKEALVTERVLERSHKLQGCSLRVEEHKRVDTYGAQATTQEHFQAQSPVIEVSGFDSSMSEDMLTLYFENERKSGGGEIKSVKFNRTHTTATITFAEMSVTDRVLKKSHSFAGQTMTVAEKKEETRESFSSSDEQDSPVRVLEVSGYKSSTSEDMLLMYFENKRRSGGGDIDDIEMDQRKTRATITFAEQTVIDRVVKKSHKLDGVQLTVIEKQAQPPRPIDNHRILLKGIPEDVTQETLMLYIENRTDIDDQPQIVYGEQPGTIMLCYEQEIQDIDSVIKQFDKRKLKKSKVSAEQVKATDGVLVQDLKADTSRDMIELYFENHRKSGGGPVSDVEMNEDENTAFVTFEDWKIVNRVTSRTHNLSGQRLTVTAHYECLGTVVSTEGPVPVVPKPMQHPVSQELMKHITEKQTSLFADEMKKYNAEVSWPCNGDRSKALIKPLPSGSDDRSVWKQWKPNVTSQFALFLERFKEDSIIVPKNIWADLSDLLPELELGNVDVDEIGNKSTLRVIGMTLDVSKAKEIIDKNIEELKAKADREANTIEKTHKLAPLKMKIFMMFAIKDELGQQFRDVHIITKDDKNEIVFKGVRGDVSETVVAMYQVFETLGTRTFKAGQNVTEFVSKFCDVVNGVLTSQNVEAVCDVEDGKVTVYGRDRSHTDRALGILQKDIIFKTMPISSDYTMKVLQSKKGADAINAINDGAEVIVRLESSNRQVLVTGLSEKVEDAIIQIGQFLDENVIIEKLIPLPSSHVKFVLKECGKELSEMRNKYPEVNMLPEMKGKKSGFLIKGNENGITGVTRMFETLKSKLVERKHTVDKAGMPELLRDPKGQRFLQSVASECNCHINTPGEAEVDDDDIISDKTGVPQTLCHVTTPKGYRLLVCQGDLTKTNVDAIVNAANPRLMHIGGLAKAIAVAGGPSIQEESIAIIRKIGRNLNTSEAVCTGPGQLPCRHVIHVCGPTWPKSRGDGPATHSQEEDLLYDAVTNSLREAHAKNLTSIAIPAISTGVYGFPIKLCAELVVEATINFMARKTSLKEIRFTNIASEQSIAFQNALKAKFGKDVIDGSTTVKKSEKRLPMPAPRSVASARPAKPASNIIMFTKKSSDTLTTKEGKDVTLKKGSLATEKADVIVNTTAGEMDLTRGNVSKALLAAAGSNLQQLCDAQVLQSDGSRRDVVAGDFIETGPANLQCQKVYHSHCPSFKEKDASKILQSMIKKILVQANKSGMASISIPAIGTGNLGFPRDVTARVMYEAVAEFSKENATSSLIDIRFWVYDKDIPTIQAFETEMQQRTAIAPIPTSAADTTIPQKKKPKRKLKKSASTKSLPVPEPYEVEEPIVEAPVMESYPSGDVGVVHQKLNLAQLQ
ncbi:protein mono-ADP-ribosyltransferase PARP14-like [Amphiura filiformis]|uniref:protein mono-ADP-ribosyltransferase PARP14-like n=1 Tax=Amphiura filiformis TaxID=82378 RepID=UPI003B228254